MLAFMGAHREGASLTAFSGVLEGLEVATGKAQGRQLDDRALVTELTFIWRV